MRPRWKSKARSSPLHSAVPFRSLSTLEQVIATEPSYECKTKAGPYKWLREAHPVGFVQPHGKTFGFPKLNVNAFGLLKNGANFM
jgi:hypothetical protein